MPQPLHQRVIKGGGVVLLFFLAVGFILDAVSNARPLISERVTYVGTITVILLMVVARFVLRRFHIPWVIHGHTARLTRLGPTSLAVLFGLIVLLWLPRAAERFLHERVTAEDAPIGRLVMGPHSVTHDDTSKRLTVVLDVHNVGDRQIVATISHAVWLQSKRQPPPPDRIKPQPWRTELLPLHFSPIVFTVEGQSATAVWNGTQEMKLTVEADYHARPGLSCRYSFSGMFQPDFQRITLLDSKTTPLECLGR